MWSSDIKGEKTISMMSSNTRKFFHLLSDSGIFSPIIKGKSLHRHHICAAEKKKHVIDK